jgi:putative endonuclease
MHYVYIIESFSSGQWYYGFTSDLEQRLKAHNKGINKSTANRGPWKYIFKRPFTSKSDALKFGTYLKNSRNKTYNF